MSSQVTIVVEKRSRRRWAAIGFLLIVSLLVIAWFAAPGVISILKSAFKGLGPALKTIPPLQQQIAFTLIIFAILGVFAALIVTLFAPKKAINVSEKDLTKERLDNVNYHK
ncbi:MAG TPA: hypothetical protein VHD90_13775, partial [Phototrophicaceae bacterium]|nr:hypothetical protein [Phototrophicaceae bacterium]